MQITTPPAHCQDLESVVAAGKELFEREWSPAQAGSVALGGDGLGPAFNDRSCVGCHRLGGSGGAGPLDKNVDMLNLPSEGLEMTNRQGRQLRQVHPGFVTSDGSFNSSIVLHKFVLDDSYAAIRRKLLNDEPVTEPHSRLVEVAQHRFSAAPLQAIATSFGLTLVRAQRNTSSLFGTGLIDQIPDEVLLALEKSQPTVFPGISGRAAPAPGGIGRFGWRAKTARLSEFVLQACANEVGLQVANNGQGIVPNKPDYLPAGVDLSVPESAALVAFVATLPPPRQRLPDQAESRALIREGRLLFAQIGCAACHLENLGFVQGLYSDLLLHDMGLALSDPAPAQPDTALLVTRVTKVETTRQTKVGDETRTSTTAGESVNRALVIPNKQSMLKSSSTAVEQVGMSSQTQQMRPATGYYGGARRDSGASTSNTSTRDSVKVLELPTMIYQEWRTPPLWGVQDSAPYLHDGRAATIVEAIAWHGGESQPSSQRFFGLTATDRLKVLAFLRTLRVSMQ